MIELTYIQSTGTQYIDTGLRGTQNTGIEIEFEFKGYTSDNNNPIIDDSTSMSYRSGMVMGQDVNKYQFHYKGTWVGPSVTADVRNKFQLLKNKVYINDTLVNTFSTQTFTTNGNITIFSANVDGTRRYSKIRVYYVKMYDNDTLVRSFIPVLDENNVACLYDEVTQQYFYNLGSGDFIQGDPVLPFYTVQYNANGGTGSMADQPVFVDVPTALSLNTFTRSDYMFAGWATSAGGSVVYTDGQLVTNLAPENETITLYAVWNVAPVGIILQTNNSENNRMDKDITDVLTLYGVFKSETSIIDPIVLIECNLLDVVNVNYMTIPKFGRSYFINNIRSIRNGLVEFSGHVDVLSSFADEIRACSGIVARNEGLYDLYLRDPEIQQLARPRFQQLLFENGYEPDVDDVSYILAVV